MLRARSLQHGSSGVAACDGPRASDGRDTGRLRRIVETIRAELEKDRLGAAAVAAGLASSLMMFVLRTHFESERADQGILALLCDARHRGRWPRCLQNRPAIWTLDELAKRANTSRATLVRLFRNAVDQPPLAFLAELRSPGEAPHAGDQHANSRDR